MEQWMKTFFLFLANNQLINKWAKRFGLHFGAGRFVAGETLADAIQTIRDLNSQGLVVTLDHLGEFVNSEQEARDMAAHCVDALEEIARKQVDSHLSLKLTSLGLDLDYQLCLTNMRKILHTAHKHQIFVRIDMEDYSRIEKTFQIYEELRHDFEHVGLVIQSYLYRSEEDIRKVSKLHTNLRLVKGAYKESPQVAYPDKKDVDNNYQKIIRLQLELGNYAAVATHDERMIDYTKKLVEELKVPRDRFEFQMLYGIRTELQKQLVREGYRVRVYVPYGTDWYGYFMRRLAERPANVAFVLKGIWKK